MRNCLVIIDVQRGFLTDDTDFIPEKIRQLTESMNFDHIVATKYINTQDSPHYLFTNWDGLMDPESQQLDEFVASISEKVFDKNINSCFSEEFVTFLRENDITKLFFVGIDTDCCVMKSAFDCFDRIIPFDVFTECCASTGGKNIHEAACEVMKRNLGLGIVK